jgi:protein-disulfide isomerase
MAKNDKKNMQNKTIVIIAIVVLIGVFFGMKNIYNQSQSEKTVALSQEQAVLFKRDSSFTIGPDNAKVQLVEYFDPACETCAQFHPYIKDILKQYKDDIQLILRYAPLHKDSDKVVVMLEAAKKQDMFLEAVEASFKTQQYWAGHHGHNLDALWNIISDLGLDMNQLADDMKNPEVLNIVRQDIKDGKKLGAMKTPSYYVNGKPLQQFGLQNLKDLIKSEMDK